jgi:hypothetical protein
MIDGRVCGIDYSEHLISIEELPSNASVRKYATVICLFDCCRQKPRDEDVVFI